MSYDRRMATPFYRSEELRQHFAFGMLIGACIAAPVAAWVALMIVRLT